jgi:hypothetical protein
MDLVAQLLTNVERTISEALGPATFVPGKFSLWLRFVRLSAAEETVGQPHKVVLAATSLSELIHLVAENAVLTVYGAAIPVVAEMPNLILKYGGRKQVISTGANLPVDQPGQIFLKVTVYEYHPGLWEQLFHRPQQVAAE